MSATYDEIEEAFDNGDLDTTYPPSVYAAYCDYMEIDIADLLGDPREAVSNIENYYIGHYESREDFFVDGLDLGREGLNAFLVIDYDLSWEANFRHEFFESEGHYFRQF